MTDDINQAERASHSDESSHGGASDQSAETSHARGGGEQITEFSHASRSDDPTETSHARGVEEPMTEFSHASPSVESSQSFAEVDSAMATQILAQFSAMRSRFNRVVQDSALSDLTSSLGEITSRVANLPGEIAKVRSRKYSFASYLEQKAQVLGQRWEETRREIQQAVQNETARFRNELQNLNRRFQSGEGLQNNPASLQSLFPTFESDLGAFEAAISGAKSRIQGLYTALKTDIEQTYGQLTTINWYLDQRDEASFPFLAEEAMFLAAKAEWVATGKGKEDPDGVLFLTDHRLLFEQKETTGKTLGLFGGKKTQQLKLDIPLNLIEKVEAENKGLFGGKDMLYFTMQPGAPMPKITVEVKGNAQCKFWAAQIKRMISGDTQDERAIQPDADMIEAMRKAPTACLSCGGTLPQLVAGQRQMECSYCGSVIRI